MAKPSRRQKELLEYVRELDHVAILDALSSFIGIPISPVLERIEQLTDIISPDITGEIVEIEYPEGINSALFNTWARRFAVASERVTKQYLHFGDEYLESVKADRRAQITRIVLQVDEFDRVEEIAVTHGSRIGLIEALAQFFPESNVGMSISGTMAVPTVEYSLSPRVGLSLPAFILDTAYRQPFIARIYGVSEESSDQKDARSFIEMLDQNVADYPVRNRNHA